MALWVTNRERHRRFIDAGGWASRQPAGAGAGAELMACGRCLLRARSPACPNPCPPAAPRCRRAELLPGWGLRHLATWHWLKVTDPGQLVSRLVSGSSS